MKILNIILYCISGLFFIISIFLFIVNDMVFLRIAFIISTFFFLIALLLENILLKRKLKRTEKENEELKNNANI